ncbi:hypothetical protein [Nostoc sp. C110]
MVEWGYCCSVEGVTSADGETEALSFLWNAGTIALLELLSFF